MKKIVLIFLLIILIAVSCSKKHLPAGPGGTGMTPTMTITASMTVTNTAALPLSPTFTMTRTFLPVSTPTITATLGCQNTGKVQQNVLALFVQTPITQTNIFCYSPDGKVISQEFNLTGYGDFKADYIYTYDGLIESQVSNINGGAGTYFVYNGLRRLTDYYAVDSYPNTNTRLTLSYDGLGRISRIDQEASGTYESYRIITRDASGYIQREDYYDTFGMTFGYVTYTRNDTAKEITVDWYYYGYNIFTLVVDYDASGFWVGAVCTAHMSPDVVYYTETNTLQSGLFDSGGIHGYYYTDPDLYMLWAFTGSTVQGFYPGP